MAGNLEVTDLPLIPAVDGADVYAAKNNLDYRVRTGEAGGLATLDGAGKVPSGQLPTGVYLPLTAGVTQPLTGSLYITQPLWSTLIFNNTTGAVNQKRAGLQVRGDNGDVALFTTQDGEAGAIQWTWTFSRSNGNLTVPGAIVVNQAFTTSTTNVVLSNNGTAGGVFLRPNGPASTTAQVVLQTSGMNVNTSAAFYSQGATGSQQVIVSYGYNNGIPRWKHVIESTGAWNLYGYDSAGGTPTSSLQCYVNPAGGQQRVIANGLVESFGPSSGFQFNDRTTSRSWTWYGSSDIARLYNGSGDITTVSTGGIWTSANFVATSDKTLKTEIADKPARRDLADKLRLVSFIWKADGRKDQGLIAQEVREIAPEYVYEQDGILSIDKTNLLLECVVDLANRVRELEGR